MAQNEQLRGVPSRCILISLSEMSRKAQFFCSKEPEGLVGKKQISLPFTFFFTIPIPLSLFGPCRWERWVLWMCSWEEAGDLNAHTVVNEQHLGW